MSSRYVARLTSAFAVVALLAVALVILPTPPPARAAPSTISSPTEGEVIRGTTLVVTGTAVGPGVLEVWIDVTTLEYFVCSVEAPADIGVDDEWEWQCEVNEADGALEPGWHEILAVHNEDLDEATVVAFQFAGVLEVTFPYQDQLVYSTSLRTILGNYTVAPGLTVRVDGEDWCTSINPDTSSWACEAPTSSEGVTTPGTHTVQLDHNDVVIESSFELATELPPPTIDTDADGTITRTLSEVAAGLDLSGRGTSYTDPLTGEVIELSVSITEIDGGGCRTTSNADGFWDCQVSSAFDPGTYTLVAAQYLPAVRDSSQSAPVSLIVIDDTVPHPLTLDEPPVADSIVYGPIVSLSGTGEFRLPIDVSVNGEPWCTTTTTPSDFTWSCAGAEPIQENGPVSITVQQGADTVVRDFRQHPIPTIPTITSPADGTSFAVTDVAGGLTVSGTATYLAGLVDGLIVNATSGATGEGLGLCMATPSTDGVWSCVLEGLADPADVQITATLAPDSSTPLSSDPVTIRIHPPLTLNAPPAQGSTVYGPITTLSGAGDRITPITATVDGAPWCTTTPLAADFSWSCSGAAPIEGNGPVSITVQQGIESVIREFTLYPTATAPTITSPADGFPLSAAAAAAGLTVSGTATYLAGVTGDLTVSATSLASGRALSACVTTPSPDGTWSCLVTGLTTAGDVQLFATLAPPSAASVTSTPVRVTIVGPRVGPVVAPPPPAPLPATAPAPTPVPTPSPSPASSPGLLTLNWQLTVTDSTGAQVDPDHLMAGSHVVVHGAGLPPNSQAQIEFHSTPTILGAVVAGEDGTFAFATTIPEDAEEGDHTLVVLVTAAGYVDSQQDVPLRLEVPVATGDGSDDDGAAGSGDDDSAAVEDTSTTPLAGDALDGGAPTILSGLRTIAELRADPPALAGALLFILAIILLLALPSELLESTLRENRHRVFRWAAPIGRGLHALRPRLVATTRMKWVGIGLTTIAAAVLTAVADSQFGFNLPTLRLMISFAVSLFVINFVATALQYGIGLRSLRIAAQPLVYPGGLVFMVLGVLVTRLTGIEPGILVGLFVGLITVNALLKQNGQFILIGAGVTTALGLLAWIAYSAWAPWVPEDADFWLRLGVETLSAITVEGLINFVILLLPLTFLDGKEVWAWSKTAWVISYAVVVALFAVVLLPLPSTWVELTTGTAILGGLLGTFGAVCIGVWAWFRFRPDPHPPAEQHEAETHEVVN